MCLNLVASKDLDVGIGSNEVISKSGLICCFYFRATDIGKERNLSPSHIAMG